MACLKIGAMKQSPSCSIHWTSHSQASQPSHIYGSSWPTFFFIYYRVFTLILPFYSLLHKLYNYFCHRSIFFTVHFFHFMLLPSYIFYLKLYNRIFISTTGHRLDLAPSIPGKKGGVHGGGSGFRLNMANKTRDFIFWCRKFVYFYPRAI